MPTKKEQRQAQKRYERTKAKERANTIIYGQRSESKLAPKYKHKKK